MGRRKKEPDPRLQNEQLVLYDRTGKETVCLRNQYEGIGGFLVCGGPSLGNYDLAELQRPSVISMGVNNAAAYAWTTHFTCADPPGKFDGDIFLDAKVCKIIPDRKRRAAIVVKRNGLFQKTGLLARDCPNVFSFVDQCRSDPFNYEDFLTFPRPLWGFRTEEEAKRHGCEKFLAAMFYGVRLMHYLGFVRVYMLGVDFSMTPDKSYAWGARGPGPAASNNEHYVVLNKMFHALAPHFEAANFRLYNCAEQSGLSAFPHVSFSKAIEDCTRGLPDIHERDLSGWYNETAKERPGVDKNGNKWKSE